MACKYQIKVVEGNEFALVLPLKRRTYVSDRPIDEDIDCTALTNVVLKIGDTTYAVTLDFDGVKTIVPATLKKGVYDIVLTATYKGSEIRAAYFEAIVIVAWNEQSDAEQYIAGSPIVLGAAFIIGGTLTDAELEELKAEFRQATADARQAQADAEAAKAEYDRKAEQLDGVAKEATSQEILQAVGHIDFSTLAKQGDNPNATNTAILAAVTTVLDDYANQLWSIVGRPQNSNS